MKRLLEVANAANWLFLLVLAGILCDARRDSFSALGVFIICVAVVTPALSLVVIWNADFSSPDPEVTRLEVALKKAELRRRIRDAEANGNE